MSSGQQPEPQGVYEHETFSTGQQQPPTPQRMLPGSDPSVRETPTYQPMLPNLSTIHSPRQASSNLSPTAPTFVPAIANTSPARLPLSSDTGMTFSNYLPASPAFSGSVPYAYIPSEQMVLPGPRAYEYPSSSQFLPPGPHAYEYPSSQFVPPGPQPYPFSPQPYPFSTQPYPFSPQSRSEYPHDIIDQPYPPGIPQLYPQTYMHPNLPSMPQQAPAYYPHDMATSPNESTPWSGYSSAPPSFSTTAIQQQPALQEVSGDIGSFRLLLAIFNGSFWRFQHPSGVTVNDPLRNVPKRHRFVRLKTDAGLRAFLETVLNHRAYAGWAIAAVMDADVGHETAVNVWIVKKR